MKIAHIKNNKFHKNYVGLNWMKMLTIFKCNAISIVCLTHRQTVLILFLYKQTIYHDGHKENLQEGLLKNRSLPISLVTFTLWPDPWSLKIKHRYPVIYFLMNLVINIRKLIELDLIKGQPWTKGTFIIGAVNQINS